MKRIIISALVGAIIVFVFQAASWMFLGIHKGAMKPTKDPAAVASVLDANLGEEAVYAVPTMGESEESMKELEGKPWALIYYHKAWDSSSMGMQMVSGFLIDFVLMLIIAGIISKGRPSFDSFSSRFMVVFGIFIVALLLTTLTEWNWWRTPMNYLSGLVIDNIIMGILAGLWMGWYWGRANRS
jgi:hypothetical protein